MRRKLILQGKKSFTVTLPIKWIKRYKVRDEVEVIEKDGTLEIRPTGTSEEKPKIKEIDITELSEFVFVRLIGACYKAGYDEIRVKYLPSQFNAIQQVVNELLGYEIIEKKPLAIIKRVTKSSPEQFYDAEKKCWHVLRSMAQDCLEALKKGDKKLLKEVIESDSIIDKFSDYCIHILLKYKELDIQFNPYSSFTFLYQLEKIADAIARIAKLGVSGLKPSKTSLELFEKIIDYISELYLAYYKFDFEVMKRLTAKYEAMEDWLSKIKPKDKEVLLFAYFREIVDSLSWLTTPLLIKNV
jgi:phosphate uptake regulator